MQGKKVGFLGLVTICVSGMIGGGVFNLPQNMASVASPVAQMVAWLITGAGMLGIACSFRALSRVKPELTNGIYTYAHAGFGSLPGALVAFSYVVYNTFSCAAYGVLICSSLNFFVPGVFEGGNNWLSTLVSSGLCWALFFLMLKGTKTSASINVVATVAKLIPVLLFIAIALMLFVPASFMTEACVSQAPDAPTLATQVSGVLPISMFAFLGIEGAVVISASSSSQKAVGKATVAGFLLVLLLYIAVSLLPFGSETQQNLAALSTPSTASFLAEKSFFVPAALMCAGVAISALAAWLVFTLMIIQMPFSAAQDRLFPACFKKTNANGAPVFSCLLASCLCQALILVAHFLSGTIWTELISIAAVLAMPCYLLSAAYLLKLAIKEKKLAWALPALVGVAFCGYAFFSAGPVYIAICCMVYLLGMPLCLHSYVKQKQ